MAVENRYKNSPYAQAANLKTTTSMATPAAASALPGRFSGGLPPPPPPPPEKTKSAYATSAATGKNASNTQLAVEAKPAMAKLPGGTFGAAMQSAASGADGGAPTWMPGKRFDPETEGTNNPLSNVALQDPLMQFRSILAQQKQGLGDVLGQADFAASRNARRSAEMSSMAGNQFGGGGFQAALAEQGIAGQQLRMKAQQEYNKENLKIRLSWLDNMISNAQKTEDRDLERELRQLSADTQMKLGVMDYNARIAETEGASDALSADDAAYLINQHEE